MLSKVDQLRTALSFIEEAESALHENGQMTGDYIMKDYSEVFELIENGEWDLTDFSVWLYDYNEQAFGEGHKVGYEKGYEKTKERETLCNSEGYMKSVYIVVYDPSHQTNDGAGKIMAVFDSADSASEYIWNWENRGKWIDEGLDLDAFYWMEKELGV